MLATSKQFEQQNDYSYDFDSQQYPRGDLQPLLVVGMLIEVTLATIPAADGLHFDAGRSREHGASK